MCSLKSGLIGRSKWIHGLILLPIKAAMQWFVENKEAAPSAGGLCHLSGSYCLDLIARVFLIF